MQIFSQANWTLSHNISLVKSYDGINIYARGNVGEKAPQFLQDFCHALRDAGIVVDEIIVDSNLSENVMSLKIGTLK